MNTVLIADDEGALRSLVRVTLDTGRFRILEAVDGLQTHKHARAEQPDLIFLDWSMPGMSGIEVCRALRADPRTAGLTVVMLTGRADDFDREAALQVGVDAYVTKPFSPVRLLDAVRDKLGPGALVT
jgi:two-component system phosphate regulon response regulator PhoB